MRSVIVVPLQQVVVEVQVAPGHGGGRPRLGRRPAGRRVDLVEPGQASHQLLLAGGEEAGAAVLDQ
jgi:hypothetical protein